VLELQEVSGMVGSCVSVEDCELSEDVGVNGSVFGVVWVLLLV
jgi:hypothetical protein